jgi:hypothetical protein
MSHAALAARYKSSIPKSTAALLLIVFIVKLPVLQKANCWPGQQPRSAGCSAAAALAKAAPVGSSSASVRIDAAESLDNFTGPHKSVKSAECHIRDAHRPPQGY